MNKLLGGKARSLIRLKQAGFNVPDFFVCDSSCTENMILQKIDHILPHAKSFAVRSSALNEDSTNKSFAGYYHSAIDVPRKHVYAQFRQVNASYKKTRGSVVIQEFIPSTIAGIVFSDAGNENMVVNAAPGTCKNVVEGGVCDEYITAKDGTILTSETPYNSLPPQKIRQITQLAFKIERMFGTPQDIEWCLLNDQLFVLQARPITKNLAVYEEEYFDSANIAESYAGIILPLTCSFAQHVYQQVYIDFLRMSGVSKQQLKQHSYVFKDLLGFFYGHMYYNMNNWYRLAQFAPGYQRNKKNFELMINSHLKKEIQCTITPRLTLKIVYPLIILLKFIVFDVTSWRFKRKVKNSIKKLRGIDLNTINMNQCKKLFTFLEQDLLRKWYVTLENDFFVMTYLGLLKKFIPENKLHEIITFKSKATEQVTALTKLSQKMQGHSRLWQTILKKDTKNFVIIINQDPDTKATLNEYLETFGGRFANELKLETIGIEKDIAKLLGILKIYATFQSPPTTLASSKNKDLPLLKRIIVNLAVHQFKKYAARREEFRLLRSNMFSLTRNIFSRAGSLMTSQNTLKHPDDVFYLTVDEVLSQQDRNLKNIVRKRKNEYETYANKTPPSHFVTKNRTAPQTNSADDTLGAIQARGVSPGVIRGKVKIMKTFVMPPIIDFDILVTMHTDPGWTPLIALSKGLVIEHGGILSHASIIARELEIPAVIGARNATDKYADGQIITVNGSTGTISEE